MKKMPHKPRRGCAYGNCSRLAVSGGQYCYDHKKLMDKRYNDYQRRPEIKKKYAGAWRKIRKRYVEKHPLCEMCLREGKYVPVDEVHHILPASRGGTHDESNLMSLCRSCHNKIHIQLGDR